MATANMAPAAPPPDVQASPPAAQAASKPQIEAIRQQLGPNNERLHKLRPDLVQTLQQLVSTYRDEGTAARRSEIRRIRQARLFWSGEQYLWFNAADLQWHPLYAGGPGPAGDAEQSGPRYQFVTNLYQAFGLSFIAVVSQDVPTVRFFPGSAQNPVDIATARAASDVVELVEANNDVQALLMRIGWLLWTDGKIGGYVRYVADGQRFGWRDEPQYAMGEQIVQGPEGPITLPQIMVTGTRRLPNGQEVITIVDGLQLNTPVWAGEQHEFPWLQWQLEVPLAKLRASYPHVADEIQTGTPADGDTNERSSRVAVAQGMPASHPGDTLHNLVTFARTWIRPWAFYGVEDKQKRDELLALFPEGCYVAFAGETYCESRSENLDDHWRIAHALPGDGQNRPAVGSSTIEAQERYNTLSNIQMETADFGIPPTYADPQVLDFDALADHTAEPAAHYPARARPGMSLADGFFQPRPAQMSPDAMKHMQDLLGPIPQFLSGLFPSIFGGDMQNVKTATGYALARDQALGRIGLVWRAVKSFYAETMMLSVECFRQNRPDDVEMALLGKGNEYESKWIRMGELKGKVHARPEADESYPRLKSQQRAVLQQLMTVNDPLVNEIAGEPANLGWIKSVLGLEEIVIPAEDSRNKQLRETQQLLAGGPVMAAPMAQGAPPLMRSTVPVNELLDRHQVEFEECMRWANSDAGQLARQQNPNGFANVHAHAQEHFDAMQRQAAVMAAMAPQAAGGQEPAAA